MVVLEESGCDVVDRKEEEWWREVLGVALRQLLHTCDYGCQRRLSACQGGNMKA